MRSSSRCISSFIGLTRDPNPYNKKAMLDLKSPISCPKTSSLLFTFDDLKCPTTKLPGFIRGFASVAEEVVSTDVDEDAEAYVELKTIESSEENARKKQAALMTARKFHRLRRRQIKIETEAWEQAAKEYRELLEEMCKKKLAPNLPYVKSLFLGWFEPLRDKIAEEQEVCKDVHCRTPYAPCFNLLPADMMAVITMHKMMGLMMTGDGSGSILVVTAACKVGEALEQEVSKNLICFFYLLHFLISPCFSLMAF